MSRFRRLQEKAHQWYLCYDAFIERKGFPIVLGVCVLVIVFSAVFTFQQREALENPAFPESEARDAAAPQQQTLEEARALIASQTDAALVPTPTPAREAFQRPVAGAPTRTFSLTEPTYFARVGCYQAHPAVDFEAEVGSPVSACQSGTVLAVETDDLYGLCVRVQHEDGYESRYCGLAEAPYARAGDPVRAGQTLGHVGNGVLAEADAPAHLHFELWQNGVPVDPLPRIFSEGVAK